MAAPTTCAPCDCDPTALALSKESYQVSQLQILCGILTAVTGGGGAGEDVNVTNGAGASAVNIQDGGNTITVDGAVTIGAAIPAGTNNIGDVDIASAIPAGSNIIGNVRIDQTTLGTTNGVSSVAATTGGYTVTRTALLATVTALKSSAQGKLGGWSIYNPNNVVEFIQVFNVATAVGVTLGTTVPTMTFPIPPFGAAIGNASDGGIDFSAGIQIAATTTATGAVAPGVALETSFWWK